MSLIKCKECGKEISNKATVCPNCGCPIVSLTKEEISTKKPKKNNKHKVLIIISCFIVICAIISVSQSLSKKGSNTTNNANNSSNNTVNNQSNTEKLININEEGSIGDWTVIITNVEITDKISENSVVGFKPADGNKYLKIDCTVTNNGTDAHTFLPVVATKNDTSAKILYQSEFEYSASTLLGSSNDIHSTGVNPLSTKSGIVVFEIPDSVAESSEELILVISAGNDKIKFKVR